MRRTRASIPGFCFSSLCRCRRRSESASFRRSGTPPMWAGPDLSARRSVAPVFATETALVAVFAAIEGLESCGRRRGVLGPRQLRHAGCALRSRVPRTLDGTLRVVVLLADSRASLAAAHANVVGARRSGSAPCRSSNATWPWRCGSVGTSLQHTPSSRTDADDRKPDRGRPGHRVGRRRTSCDLPLRDDGGSSAFPWSTGTVESCKSDRRSLWGRGRNR